MLSFEEQEKQDLEEIGVILLILFLWFCICVTGIWIYKKAVVYVDIVTVFLESLF